MAFIRLITLSSTVARITVQMLCFHKTTTIFAFDELCTIMPDLNSSGEST